MGLDAVEIVMEVEKDFGIKVADADAEKARTVADLRDLVLAQLLGEPDRLAGRLKHLIFLHLQTILSEQLGVRTSKIKLETRFVEDLGV